MDRGELGAHGSGATQAERVLVRAAMLYRLFGLVQLAVALALDMPRYRHPAGVLGLVAAVSLESAVLAAVMLRRRRLVPWMIAADTVFNAAGLIVGAALTASAYGHTWVYFMYPFSMVGAVGIGLACRRLDQVLGLTVVLAVTYVAAAVGLHHDPGWNAVPNTGAYFANTVVAWAVAAYLRRAGVRLDEVGAQAVARAATLAAEQERLRHARMLHDHVLQTLETLARGDWIADSGFRAHIRAEAAWLRSLVEGFGPGEPDDLAVGLQRLIRDKALMGLQVEFNGTRLRDFGDARTRLGDDAVRALVEAAGEALNNVAKHSGAGSALMRVNVTADRLTLSVLDHGCGFDTATARQGLGLRQSMQTRLREVGGVASIESTVGHGTFVELSVPLLEAAAVPRDASRRPGALEAGDAAPPSD
ncbi:sensor histidine kinase [Actinoallomurus rhizosphaericola]|uniref:sensor histidine kinase n=1 Tax=Actinoallomurus rhizosphaericola TaxID=2952536 RepID=UPI002093F9FC|nr:ATP-binding protein [Actinoallomurus rhizosphaericola]MCO5999960.1 hypothetical protein [Actinoallomurus rhizosphaericola]